MAQELEELELKEWKLEEWQQDEPKAAERKPDAEELEPEPEPEPEPEGVRRMILPELPHYLRTWILLIRLSVSFLDTAT